MRRSYYFLLAILMLALVSCEKDVIEQEVENTLENQNEAVDLMALAMSKAMANIEFRELIRNETNKQFDFDYDVLYRFIKDRNLDIDGGITLSCYLLDLIDQEIRESLINRSYLEDLDKYIPNLNICVPFQYKDWKPKEYTPIVGAFPIDFDEKTHSQIKSFDGTSKNGWLTKAEIDWVKPVVTLGLSERIDNDGLLKVNAGSIIIDKEFRTITAEDAYEYTSTQLKSGIIPVYEPLIEIVDNDFFTGDLVDVKEGESDLESKDMILLKSSSVSNSSLEQPSIVKMHSAVDNRYCVQFEWESVAGATHYEIWRSRGSGVFSKLTVVDDTYTTYTNYALWNEATYNYKVKAINENTSEESNYSQVASHVGGWRKGKGTEKIDKIYIDSDCWKDISWGRSVLEIYIKVVKFNYSDGTVEYPHINLGQESKSNQKDEWCSYDRTLFYWDMTKYASNYFLYFYEEDGGTPTKVTLGGKLWVGNPGNIKTGVGGSLNANVEFEIGGRDDYIGFVEVFNWSGTEST